MAKIKKQHEIEESLNKPEPKQSFAKIGEGLVDKKQPV